MPDPETMQQVHNAANDAARSTDSALWSALSMVLGGGIVAAVKRFRGDGIIEELRNQGCETRETLTDLGKVTHAKLDALTNAVAHLQGQMDRR